VRLKCLPALLAAPAARTTTTAAAVESAAASFTSTTTGSTLLARTSLVNVQGTAIDLPAIHYADGGGGLSGIGHFDEGESTRLSGVAIANDANAFHCPKRCEGGLKLTLGRLIRQIPYKNIGHFHSSVLP
jgi:hypothetical protein